MAEPNRAQSPIRVESEIGKLEKVLVHRPGEELDNLPPEDLRRLLFDDVPFLEVARQEHDAFAEVLRNEGVEVCYLERLVAEALDAHPGLREVFVDQWLAESGVAGLEAPQLIRDYLLSIEDTQALVEKTMAGVTKEDVEIPKGATHTLAAILGTVADTESNLLVDPMPSLYFTRDPFACVGQGVMIDRMRFSIRRRETIYAEYLFTYHPDYARVPRWYDRSDAYFVEGGDVLVLDASTLAIGVSQRTEASAVDLLCQRLFWGETESPVRSIYAFDIPDTRAFMHLDTVFTQVDVDAFTIHPAILGALTVYQMTPGRARGDVRIVEHTGKLEEILASIMGLDSVRLIPCGNGDSIAASREQWSDGSNTLAVAPGRVVVYQRNVLTNEALADAGAELLVVPSAELSRGRGGPRCMSMPFARDPIGA